ncbi:MAG: phosphatidylglycerophosphatase A [Desulfobulbaceae bacterium]|nr:MAG: phosphatidylglycerophosphatase A [Desulfobulbaceae bacterium]
MDKLVMAIATGFYSGYTPKAPGTAGTLVAFPVHLLIVMLPGNGYYLALAAILVLAIATAGMAEKIIDRQDPGMVVIDEIIGMLIGLIAVPLTLPALATAFLLFRTFDIWKPFPVSWFDKHLHGGTGIVLDDVMAGIYTLACMQGLIYLAVF